MPEMSVTLEEPAGLRTYQNLQGNIINTRQGTVEDKIDTRVQHFGRTGITLKPRFLSTRLFKLRDEISISVDIGPLTRGLRRIWAELNRQKPRTPPRDAILSDGSGAQQLAMISESKSCLVVIISW